MNVYGVITKVNTVLSAVVVNNNNNVGNNNRNNSNSNNDNISTITNNIIKLLVTINRVYDKISNHHPQDHNQ